MESIQGFIGCRVRLEVLLDQREQLANAAKMQQQQEQQQQGLGGRSAAGAHLKGTRVGGGGSQSAGAARGASLRQSVHDIQTQLGLAGIDEESP